MELLNSFVELHVAIKLPVIALIAYLLGSINTSILVSKIALKKDIRNYGSGNAGFTNAVRSMGWKKGLIVMFGDIGKCALAVVIGQLLYIGSMNFDAGAGGRLIAGTFVFLGHIYPLYFGFKGGKGVLTFGITILMFDWRIFLIAFSLFLIILFTTKLMSLASICAAISVLPLVVVFLQTPLSGTPMPFGYFFVALFMVLVIIFKHRTNIKRLITKTESKFSFKSNKLMEK
ncbi:MAG: glycerol-3-phosphate 1-O-acyltransferase PlsY [Clostridia bacterium]|nr:glycerol-3-phosphate 1-O-acyltransferase PlsY [Oscillospiraceae bacterium]MBQ4048721.1 glycerol-3-phosphate 1-O-acyltransferase PlsY [Clostridia bacterium]MBR7137614.1 glycerol-3-phosphate 1-O-acyltransferase PlsY [Clostridia bacterium]